MSKFVDVSPTKYGKCQTLGTTRGGVRNRNIRTLLSSGFPTYFSKGLVILGIGLILIIIPWTSSSSLFRPRRNLYNLFCPQFAGSGAHLQDSSTFVPHTSRAAASSPCCRLWRIHSNAKSFCVLSIFEKVPWAASQISSAVLNRRKFFPISFVIEFISQHMIIQSSIFHTWNLGSFMAVDQRLLWGDPPFLSHK